MGGGVVGSTPTLTLSRASRTHEVPPHHDCRETVELSLWFIGTRTRLWSKCWVRNSSFLRGTKKNDEYFVGIFCIHVLLLFVVSRREFRVSYILVSLWRGFIRRVYLGKCAYTTEMGDVACVGGVLVVHHWDPFSTKGLSNGGGR